MNGWRAGRRMPLILVVEDEPMQRLLCRKALNAAGFDSIEVEDGAQALSAFARHRPDAVLLDLVMPGMDGFAACASLRALPGGRGTPILMVTGLDDIQSVARAYDAGATDFITKPLNWMILIQRIRYMLRADESFRRLQVSEQRLGEAQRIAALGNFVWTPGQRQLECSAGMLRLFWKPEGLGTLPLKYALRRIPPSDRARLRRAIRDMTMPERVLSIDLDIQPETGGQPETDRLPRNILLRTEIRVDETGARSIQGTIQDITERKRVEAELAEAREAQEANAARSVFLATMSHELRTPLNAIMGFSELISMQTFGPIAPRYAEYAGNILTAGRHMHELVGDILTMSKLESGRYPLNLEAVPLRIAAESTLALFRGTEMARDHWISLVEKGNWATIEADERAIKQMLLNLLANAVKFSPPGTLVEVNCDRGDEGQVRLSVTDHGIGMTADEAAEAILPFRQIDTRLARKYGGSGLGLSIVKRLIERHGGHLAIDSTPGEGSSVTLIFPQPQGLP